MTEKKLRSTNGGRTKMHLATMLFFVSFAMAVFAVYTYQRSAETVYDRLVLDLHAAKSELQQSKGAYDLSVVELDELQTQVSRLTERLESLEQRPGEVTLKGTSRIEVMNIKELMNGATQGFSPKSPALVPQKSRMKRATQ